MVGNISKKNLRSYEVSELVVMSLKFPHKTGNNSDKDWHWILCLEHEGAGISFDWKKYKPDYKYKI